MPRPFIALLLAAAVIAAPAAAEDSYARREASPAMPQVSNGGHEDPEALNELAVRYIRQGDPATGRILLERAALLAPHDERIQRNLREMRAYFGAPSTFASNSGQMPAPAAPAPVKEFVPLPSEPPPLWPLR
ncbi:MAG TPA: hypothetical protein VEC06_14540 [Paucimonas sp.]|nr:hypothetical protein [Paucimonas sp.]